MEPAGYVLHGAVHSGSPFVELLLSLLPVVVIIGGAIGAYLVAGRDRRAASPAENSSDEPI
jgi:hypothetical protein